MNKVILVTGATGKTGAYTIPLLLQRGHSVRAFVHREDERSERLRSLGADIRVGDLLDYDAVSSALQGVERAYFCYPIAPGLVEATAYFAQAGREAGLSAVVNMSQISARREALSNAARQHWVSERIFDWSGIPATHLRPTFFAEWLTLGQATGPETVLRLPFGDGRHAPIASEDQAHVIASILEDPEPHAGQTYELFGPTEMNHHEIAAEMTRALGRTIRYEPITIEAFSERLVTVRDASAHLVQHLASVARDYQEGVFAGVNDVVERVGHTTPTGVASWVEKNRSAFGP